MANPDQKTILIEQASKEIREICIKYQVEYDLSNSELKALLIELANIRGAKEKNKFGFR